MLTPEQSRSVEGLVEKMRPLDSDIKGGLYSKRPPLVTIEEYFAFPDATMWCNVFPEHESVVESDFWQELRSKDRVIDLRFWLIQIDAAGSTEQEMLADINSGNGVIYSDKGVLITTAALDDVASWFEGVAMPDQLEEWPADPETYDGIGEAPKPQDGNRIVYFWYD